MLWNLFVREIVCVNLLVGNAIIALLIGILVVILLNGKKNLLLLLKNGLLNTHVRHDRANF